MTNYRLGDHGKPVEAIQQALQTKSIYRGPIDGRFGGGTQAAVQAFQKAKGITVDGVVGEQTWALLFDAAPPLPVNPLLDRPLAERCLALSGSFETGAGFPDCFAGVTGDFDGQGLSLGVAQWNFGQGSLQPLLNDALKGCRDVMADAFHEKLAVLEAVLADDRAEQLAFARSIQDGRTHRIYEPWNGMFKTLCRAEPFQRLQTQYAGRLFDRAGKLVEQFELVSERAYALMFDIVIQNGGIAAATAALIRADFSALPQDLRGPDLEQQRLRIVAARRAEAAKPEWMDDVRSRKLCIANGRGRVHGIDYDIEAQFGVKLSAPEKL